MRELQKPTSIFIEKVSCHQYIKNTLLEKEDDVKIFLDIKTTRGVE